MSLLPAILLTGAEAKRSFAQSSLPSFLSRKRAYFSFKKSKLRKRVAL